MKSTFDKSTRDELIARINLLNENSNAEWGTMNVYQMIRHCILWDEMVIGNKKYKRVNEGRLFGKKALMNVLKDENPLNRNSSSIPDFIIKETNGDIANERIKWMAIVEQYADFTDDKFNHPFFGKMTREQIGYLAYKHIDHHLRQFGK